MPEWCTTTLGAVAEVNPREPPLGDQAPFITMADVKTWGTWAESTSARGSRGGVRARGGDVLMARITPCLENGKIAKVPERLGRVGGSTEFVVLRGTEYVLSDFLFLWASSPKIHAAAVALMTGSTGRQRVSASDIANLPLHLPPLDEQRRIVGVVSSIDAQTDALQAESRTVDRLTIATITSLFSAPRTVVAPLDSLCSLIIGGMWGDPPGESEVDLLALGPRIYSPGTSDFVTTGSPFRSYSKNRSRSRIVQPGDVILERSGGSPDQPVGRVVIAGDDLPECVPTDFQRLLRPDVEQVDPRFLFWTLKHDWASGVTAGYSRRTTGITNLSVKDYLARSVVVPEMSEQRRVVAIADALDSSKVAANAELARLRGFRSALLTALLSQTTTVPASYDALLDAVTGESMPRVVA